MDVFCDQDAAAVVQVFAIKQSNILVIIICKVFHKMAVEHFVLLPMNNCLPLSSEALRFLMLLLQSSKLAIHRFKGSLKCSKCSGQVFLIYRLIEDLFKQLAVCGIAGLTG